MKKNIFVVLLVHASYFSYGGCKLSDLQYEKDSASVFYTFAAHLFLNDINPVFQLELASKYEKENGFLKKKINYYIPYAMYYMIPDHKREEHGDGDSIFAMTLHKESILEQESAKWFTLDHHKRFDDKHEVSFGVHRSKNDKTERIYTLNYDVICRPKRSFFFFELKKSHRPDAYWQEMQDISLGDSLVTIQSLILQQHYKKIDFQPEKIDTIQLFQDKIGVPKRIYSYIFHKNKSPKEYGYAVHKTSKQDSIVLHSSNAKYYSFYDKNKELKWCGQSWQGFNCLIGEKVYYDKGGRVRRVEFYDNKSPWHEMPGPEGIWQWYRKDGTIKKVVIYIEGKGHGINRRKRTIKFNRKEKIKSDKTVNLKLE